MPDEPSPAPESAGSSGSPGDVRSPLDALVERWKLPPGATGKLTQAVLLLGASVGAAFLVSPGLYSQQLPQLTAEDVGRPFRWTSPSGFKAGRDYEIVDKAATEQRREEARAAVRPVFDYDPSVQSNITQTVQHAFDVMQELVARHHDELEAGKAEHGTKKRKDEGEKEHVSSYPSALIEARKAFELILPAVEDEDFAALLAAKFSREVEHATLTLIETAYRAKISISRDELSRVGAQGITVRVLGGSREHLSGVEPPRVFDISEAQSELERFASVPGNLLPDSPMTVRRAVLRLAKRQIHPNLTINIAETDARRRAAAEAVKDSVITIRKGQRILGDGELVGEVHLVMLASMRAQTDQLDVLQLQLGGTGLVALLIGGVYAFCRAAFRRFRPTRKDALLLGLLLLVMLGLMHLWVTVSDAVHDRYATIPPEALYFAIPVAAGAMLVRFVLCEELALFFAVVLSCLAGVMLNNSLSFAMYSLIGSLVASDQITRAKDRLGIFRAGLVTGTVSFLAVLFFSLAEGKGVSAETFLSAGFAFAGTCVAVPVMVMALTPLIEVSFGYASDIKLLELANLNHPALKELIVQAPGTYHHSIIIGSLVEAAAEAIGANPLLARSCAYYHDIGKGRNPLYFGENQKGENRHDALAPAMSAVIIKRHVTEGLEMARQYKLPKLVADAIPQHHGTRLVGFFFHKAVKEQEGKENPQAIDDSIYRYPGPKPQFREAALVMIADAVEAASRAMPEPSTPKLQALVHKLINMIFSEGQLDECDLTLKDLNLIAHSFVHTLEGIYHARPQYPPGAVAANTKTGLSAEPVKAPLAVAKPLEGKSDTKRSAGS
ncbi:MAG: HD family phosphohydrolase [Myxococcota bacterium]